MKREMDEIDVILGGFDSNRKLTKSKAFSFMCHCVVDFISAREAFEYMKENGLNVKLRTVVSWRRSAAEWLGLAQSGRGRVSESDSQQMRSVWHQKHGYPTYQDFFNGWKPGDDNVSSVAPQPTASIPVKQVDESTNSSSDKPQVSRPRRSGMFTNQPSGEGSDVAKSDNSQQHSETPHVVSRKPIPKDNFSKFLTTSKKD